MSSEKEMRLIVLRGGEWNGKVGQCNQDFIYVMDKAEATHQTADVFTKDGQWNKDFRLGKFLTAHRYNATGELLDKNETSFEVFEYVGDDYQNVFVPYADD